MGRLCTPPPDCDPWTTVFGVAGDFYDCPDPAAIDAHLARLRRRIGQTPPRFPRIVALLRDDIDLLLQRRADLVAGVWAVSATRGVSP